MSIDNLTIGEAKQLVSLFSTPPKSEIYSSLIGKYVIVRTYNEGVNAGVVQMADETGIVLSEARRLWYHEPKDPATAWFEGVAMSGLSDGSQISVAVPEKTIIENYSVTPCSQEAEFSIRNHKAHEPG